MKSSQSHNSPVVASARQPEVKKTVQQPKPKRVRKSFLCSCGRITECRLSKDHCMSGRCNPCITAAKRANVERDSHGHRMSECPGCGKPTRLDWLKRRGPNSKCQRCGKLEQSRQMIENSWQRIHVKDRKTASVWKNVQSVEQPSSQVDIEIQPPWPKRRKLDDGEDCIDITSTDSSTRPQSLLPISLGSESESIDQKSAGLMSRCMMPLKPTWSTPLVAMLEAGFITTTRTGAISRQSSRSLRHWLFEGEWPKPRRHYSLPPLSLTGAACFAPIQPDRHSSSAVVEGPRWIPQPKTLKMLKLAALSRPNNGANSKLVSAFHTLKQVRCLGKHGEQTRNFAHGLWDLLWELQPQLKLIRQFKMANKQFQSYSRFLEYMRVTESEEDQPQATDAFIQSPSPGEQIMLSEKHLKNMKVAHNLDAVVAQILELMQQIDSNMQAGSPRLHMLKKSGLITFAKRLRQQLLAMKHNCIRKVAQKSFAKAELLPGVKVKLRLHVLDKIFTVVLKHDYEPWKDTEETLADYWARYLVFRDDVLKLFEAVDLAKHFEKSIDWKQYRRMFLMQPAELYSVDFFRSAFIYGARVERVFDPWYPLDYAYMRIYRMIFSKQDRQLCFVSTVGHEIVVRVANVDAKWFKKLLKIGELIFKADESEQVQDDQVEQDVLRLDVAVDDADVNAGSSDLVLL